MATSRYGVFHNLYHQPCCGSQKENLFRYTKSSVSFIQKLTLDRIIPAHKGCVNSIQWDRTGTYLLSGSDDQHLAITHGHRYKVLWKYKTVHKANIFCAKFLPHSCDYNVISSSGDGMVLHTDLHNTEASKDYQIMCHFGAVYEIETMLSEPTCFMTCGEDGTVRWFDLRVQNRCKKRQCKENVIISHRKAVTALTINPLRPYQVSIGTADSVVRLYDRRFTRPCSGLDLSSSAERLQSIHAFTVGEFHNRAHRITALQFSKDSDELLVSFSSECIYMFNVQDQSLNEFKKAALEQPDEEKMRKYSFTRPPMPKLRLRGDWSDTGPEARPGREITSTPDGVIDGTSVETMQSSLMQRMTQVLSRMLNDPATRAAFNNPTIAERESRDVNQNEMPEVSSSETPIRPVYPNGTKSQKSEPSNDDIPVLYLPFTQKFAGHRNVRTMIKEATFWGSDHIMSGSDCGHIFIWDRKTAKLVMILQGDQHVVNCLQPHPTLPYLASSGIDYDIKLWSPISEDEEFDPAEAEALVKRNAKMLEETRDTITVPASFMIRMIARIRRRARLAEGQVQDQDQEQDQDQDQDQDRDHETESD